MRPRCRLRPSRSAAWRLLLVGLLVWCVARALVLFPGETWRDRLLYRIAVLREPSVILTKEASSLPDSSFTESQLASIRTCVLWAMTPTTRCRRQAVFGGQIYSSPKFETRIVEGDRPVCLDAGFGIADPAKRCVVYSFGISNDWSFDDAMARFGCEVHSFDPSLALDEHRRPSGVHFHPVGAGRNSHVNVRDWNITTLDEVVQSLGHAQLPRMQHLKIDGEGAEFDMLSQQLLDKDSMNALDKFDQISMELHFRLDPEKEMEFYTRVALLTERLHERGWAVADSVPNKIYNVWFRFPGMEEHVSHMFDVLLLNRRLVPE